MIWRLLASVVARFIGPLVAYFKGRSDAKRKARLKDHENAEDIRRRLERDRAERLRRYDDAGWRD
jgi:hypothetical protein